MITIELPFPPSVNNYWQVARNRIIKTKQARDYKQTVQLLLLTYHEQIRIWNTRLHKDGSRRPGKDTRTLALSVAVHYPKRRGPLADIDNLLKVSIDCLEGFLFENDRQFRHIQISKEKSADTSGHIRVTIKECPDELEVHDGTFTVDGIHGRGVI